MSIKVEKITEPLLLGEAPHWDSQQEVFFFVGIPENTLHKYVPVTGEHTRTKVDGPAGFIVPVDGTTDQFVLGMDRKFLVVQWDGQEGSQVKVVRVLGEVDQELSPATRLNDGKADPRGRLYAGTMGHEEAPLKFSMNRGSLFRVDGSNIQKVEQGVSVSNGLAWDVKEKAFYYIDSLEYNIRRYDYDVETGDISNMRYIFDFKKNNIGGFPDGATIDTDGNLWVCVFDGGCVIQIDPRTGRLLRTVAIPAKQVTSATWGGRDLDVLFVTTARLSATDDQPPPSGACFLVKGLGAKGYPNVNFKL